MHFFIVSIPTHNTLAVLRSEDTTIDVVDRSSADVHVENAVVVVILVLFHRFYHYKYPLPLVLPLSSFWTSGSRTLDICNFPPLRNHAVHDTGLAASWRLSLKYEPVAFEPWKAAIFPLSGIMWFITPVWLQLGAFR